jgi:hypothetical protein
MFVNDITLLGSFGKIFMHLTVVKLKDLRKS